MHIRFSKLDRFIRNYDGSKYLLLFGLEKYDTVYVGIRYLIGTNSSLTYIFSQCYTKIKVNSYGSLPLEKVLTLDNAIILIKLVLSKDENQSIS